MRTYPLALTYDDITVGDGWIVSVSVRGLAVLEEHQDGTWAIMGVHPGSMSAEGASPLHAWRQYCLTYRRYLLDCADRFSTPADFEAEIRRDFAQTDETAQRDFQGALGIWQ